VVDWSQILCTWMAANSGGNLVLNTNFFRTKLPHTVKPTTIGVVLRPTSGRAPDLAVGFDYPRFQVSVRCVDFSLANAEALRIYNQLSRLDTTRLGSSPDWLLVSACRAQSTPFPIGQDEQQCWLVVNNYELELQGE